MRKLNSVDCRNQVYDTHRRRIASEVRSQRSEVRGQRSEVRGQRSEVRGQKSEVRIQEKGAKGKAEKDYGFWRVLDRINGMILDGMMVGLGEVRICNLQFAIGIMGSES